MKARHDFVTNSSSSSFIIYKDELSAIQIEALRNHSEIGNLLGLDYAGEQWDIYENKNYIGGSTWMDNFCMLDYMEIFGIDVDEARWSEHRLELPEEENIYED